MPRKDRNLVAAVPKIVARIKASSVPMKPEDVGLPAVEQVKVGDIENIDQLGPAALYAIYCGMVDPRFPAAKGELALKVAQTLNYAQKPAQVHLVAMLPESIQERIFGNHEPIDIETSEDSGETA